MFNLHLRKRVIHDWIYVEINRFGVEQQRLIRHLYQEQTLQEVMQKEMYDNVLQKRGRRFLLASRKSDLVENSISHTSHHFHCSAVCVHVGVCESLTKRRSFHHRPTYTWGEISVSQPSLHVTNPQAKATSALHITWCSVGICHMTNSFFPINPSLRLIGCYPRLKKDGRQLLVAFAAIVVFFASVWGSNTARYNCLTKTSRGGSAAKIHTANTSVGYESNAVQPLPPLWIPFLICAYSKENKCEGNMTSHRPQEEEIKHLYIQGSFERFGCPGQRLRRSPRGVQYARAHI